MEKIINTLIKFPIWKNDRKPLISLNDLQKRQIENFVRKIQSGEYKLIHNPCLCGNKDTSLDILISEKDRYGIPCEILLCKRCGLIRLKEKLDEQSTADFYKNYYRDIYVGREVASDEFFNEQIRRGQGFLNLLMRYVNLKDIKNVFEVGCGAGGILYPFYKEGLKVSGCDFNEKYLRYGKEMGLDLYQGEIDILKTPKRSQDLVILSHVMEHFNEPIEKMNEIIEFIADGKYLLVEVPGFFWIPKIYFNPILYFQNAHVYNYYYYYYLKTFFETLGLEVLYGDERCTFLLRKPLNWEKNNIKVVYDEKMRVWAEKIEVEIKKYYLLHVLKLNPYYLRIGLIKILDKLRIKNAIKKIIGQ